MEAQIMRKMTSINYGHIHLLTTPLLGGNQTDIKMTALTWTLFQWGRKKTPSTQKSDSQTVDKENVYRLLGYSL
ncbi:hypothetical protein UPYG_G00106630 [Umbra pygmaea]|uniref:Uncharacterized protein n=1 Tax=Umbra pygmaea TaxID=75934 RepID=A0ABD0X212_UMBPY